MKVVVALVTDYIDWLGDCVRVIYQLAVNIQRLVSTLSSVCTFSSFGFLTGLFVDGYQCQAMSRRYRSDIVIMVSHERLEQF